MPKGSRSCPRAEGPRARSAARGHFLTEYEKSEVEWGILSYIARQPPIFAIYAPPQDTYHIFKLNKMQHAKILRQITQSLSGSTNIVFKKKKFKHASDLGLFFCDVYTNIA